MDTLGLLVAVVGTAATLDDGTYACLVVQQLAMGQSPRLPTIFADNKYHQKTLPQWLADHQAPYRIDISTKPAGAAVFQPVTIRWVVAHAQACHGRCRRLSKDDERRTDSSATWIPLSAIQRMGRRLRPDPNNRQAAFTYPKGDKKAG